MCIIEYLFRRLLCPPTPKKKPNPVIDISIFFLSLLFQTFPINIAMTEEQ